MYNPQLYDKISQDVFARYNKDKHSNELLSIQNFLDNITNECIKNKKDALEEFKTVKNNVKCENLRDYIKDLELAIFGHDNEEPKYEESIAERTKMRRQNKETDKKDVSRTFASPSSTIPLPHPRILTTTIQINLQKCIIHLIVRLLMMKRLKRKQNRHKKYMRKVMIKKVMMSWV